MGNLVSGFTVSLSLPECHAAILSAARGPSALSERDPRVDRRSTRDLWPRAKAIARENRETPKHEFPVQLENGVSSGSGERPKILPTFGMSKEFGNAELLLNCDESMAISLILIDKRGDSCGLI